MNMPSAAQIVERIERVKEHDFFGSQVGDLVDYLDYADAKQYLRDDVTEAEWTKIRSAVEPPEVVARNYLPFAWGKANDQRGLSAIRSVDHMRAYLFMAGREDLANEISNYYEFYGKPCLVLASEFFGFDWRAHDDGCWTNDEGDEGISKARIDALAARMTEIAKRALLSALNTGE